MNNILLRSLVFVLGIMLPQQIYAQLSANFSASPVSGCSPILVQFTDLSTGSPTSWTWNLGNGTISNVQNPSTVYVNPGTYTVTLTVTSGANSDTKVITNYINVIPSPEIYFTASDSSITCPPKTVQFTSQSILGSTGTAIYFWDFGDGNTSNAPNPSHTYFNGGNYSVTLSITNSAGCMKLKTKSNYIPVSVPPVANFTSSNNVSCAVPSTVNFTNTTTGAISYFWTFGSTPNSTQTNPSHIYNVGGAYTVTLIATNANGCKDTIIKPSFVNIGPMIVNFTKSSGSACKNVPISFTNTTLPAGGNSTWYFGDGATATGTNPSHAYTTSGTYTVKLIVSNNNCTDSSSQTVTILPSPTSNFSANPTIGCTVPLNVQFTNLSTGATSYSWSFGNGNTSTSTNPTNTYTSLGIYTVTLVSSSANNCKDTLTQTSFINISTPKVIVTADTMNACSPATINFSATSTPTVTTFNWNLGNGTIITGGTSISYTYNSPGIYNVTASNNTLSGCNLLSMPLQIHIGTPPVPSFTSSTNTACPGLSITFTNTSTSPPGTVYYWNFSDGGYDTTFSPVHVFSNQGSYLVTLTATNQGCSVTFSSVIVITPPLSSFTIFDGQCTNKKNISTVNSSTVNCSYLWNFGDGTTSTLINPTHSYANYGNYTVTLQVTSPINGCTATSMIPLKLYNLTGNFLVSDSVLCHNNTDTFSAIIDTSIAQAIQNYSWYFGDGSSLIDTDSVVIHTYSLNGLYTVKLVITDSLGCKDTITKTNYINIVGPTVGFYANPVNVCKPGVVTFVDTTNSPNGFASRKWKFGDGGTSNLNSSNVQHTYTANGVYSVKLVVTDSSGCKDSLLKNNYISCTKPTASFYSNDTVVCKGYLVNFHTPQSNTLIYTWDFGDGNTAATNNPSHAYSQPGNYTVQLIVTNINGCKDTLIKPAYIHVSSIKAGFTISDTFSACPPLSVFLADTTAGATTHFWLLGNGNSSSLINPTALYTLPGHDTVTLISSNGICTDTVKKVVHILGPTGTFTYSPLNGCYPLTVTFNATTQNTVQIIWDMNNGVTINANQPSITYTYNQTGSFLPVFVLSNGQNCTVPYIGTDTIKVGHLSADFSFSPSPACENTVVHFTDTVLDVGVVVASRYWSFGDGDTSTLHNPIHVYNSSGSFTVKLIIAGTNGCSDTVTKQITILPAPNITLTNNMAFCQGQFSPIQLQASGAISFSWSPSSTLSCNTCSNPIATPTVTTTYQVVGTNTIGCKDTGYVTIGIDSIPEIIVTNSQTTCSNDTVQLNVSGSVNYSWTPAVGLTCSNCPNPIANPQTTTTYTVIGTNPSGCADTDQVTITVIPAPNVVAGPDDSICKYGHAQLHASGLPLLSWNPSSTLSCPVCPDPVATPLVTTTYVVSGSDNAGCNDSDTVVVFVFPVSIISAGPDTTICFGKALTLNASGANSYTWIPPTGLSCNNCPNPIANPTDTTHYIIIGLDSNGCNDTGFITINVIPKFPTSYGTNDSICLGDSTTLFASGGSSYLWYPSSTLSCDTCSHPTAWPTTITDYTVIIHQGVCFTDTGIVRVTVFPWPTVNAGPDQKIIAGNSITLFATSTNTVRYLWTPAANLSCDNCQSPVATPLGPATYIVTAYNQIGCEATDTINLYMLCDNAQLFLANTFTPNGDGHNDLFYPQGKGMQKILQFRVYNRWGETVFEADDIQPNNEQSGWDGIYKGEALKPDVYVYFVKAVCYTGEIIEIKGDVSLIR